MPSPALPGGPPPKRAHTVAQYTGGPIPSFRGPRVSITTTIAESTPAPELYDMTPPTKTDDYTMFTPRAVVSPSPPSDEPSVSSATWSTLTDSSQLIWAPLDLSPLDNILPLWPYLRPGENLRRNCLSRRRFRKLRKISHSSLTKAALQVRENILEDVESTPPPPPPVRRIPTLPRKKTTLSIRAIMNMVN